MSEELVAAFLTTIVTLLVTQCPVFLALIVGAVVGIMAFLRNNKLAGTLTFCGFAALVVLLFLQLLSGALPMLMFGQGMGREEMMIMQLGLGCTFSVLKAAGLLAVIGALAACAFQARRLDHADGDNHETP